MNTGILKKLTIGIFAAVSVSGVAYSATIISDDFTGVSTANPTASFGAWDTVNGINAPASSLTFSGIDGFFTAVNLISIDRNVDTEGAWSTTIPLVLDGSTSTIDLTNFSVLTNYTSNSGSNQVSNRTIKLTVDVTGSVSGSLGSSFVDHTDPSGATTSTANIDLSGLPSLTNLETYTLTFTASTAGGPGVNMAFDDLELTGDITPIPEPSAGVLAILGGLTLLLRRRK